MIIKSILKISERKHPGLVGQASTDKRDILVYYRRKE